MGKKYKLWISGSGPDMDELKNLVEELGISDCVVFFGRTSDQQKLDLMKKASVLVSTSKKEGWGLIVTEANSQATPAVVYDVDGLRDSAKFEGNEICYGQNIEKSENLQTYTKIPNKKGLYKDQNISEEGDEEGSNKDTKVAVNNQPQNMQTQNMQIEMTKKLVELYQEFNKNQIKYQKRCDQVLQSSKTITFDQSYKDLKKILGL